METVIKILLLQKKLSGKSQRICPTLYQNPTGTKLTLSCQLIFLLAVATSIAKTHLLLSAAGYYT